MEILRTMSGMVVCLPQSIGSRQAVAFGNGSNGWKSMKKPDKSNSEMDGIIASLYAGVFESPYWGSFLERFRTFTQANYASLTFQRADARYDDIKVMKTGTSNQARVDRGNPTEIVRKLSLPYSSLDTNRPYQLHEILDFNDEKNSEYIQYLTENDLTHAVVMRVVVPKGGTCWISIGCSEERYTSHTGDLLSRIAPHLSCAARILADLEHERMRADIASEVVQRLNFGWLTFDAEARIIEIDPGMESVIRHTPELRSCVVGRPFPLRRSAKYDLAEILRAYGKDGGQSPRAIHLIDEPWLDMLVRPIGHRSLSGAATPVAVGYVHGVGVTSADRLGQLEQLFGLTGSEARLALALSQGRTITEGAGDVGLTIETARNYSKRIYSKTGARGQADLVRIILASVISIS